MSRFTRRQFLAGAAAAGLVAVGVTKRWWLRRALIRTGLQSPPSNFLRNAGFLESATGGVPDYWGTLDAATLGDVTALLQTDRDAPLSGVRSLRVTNPTSGFELTLLGCMTFIPKPEPYTFSAYLRTDADRQPVGMQLGWGPRREVVVGRAWQRVEITHVPASEAAQPYGLETRFLLPGPGTVWIAGPKVELGAEATPFDIALIDDHPLPEIPWPDDWEIRPQAPASGRVRLFAPGSRRTLMAIHVANPSDAAMADVAGHGFDTVVLFLPQTNERALPGERLKIATEWFDAAHARGLRVICGPAGAQGTDVAAVKAYVLEIVAALKLHPALSAWMFFDEPSRSWKEPPWSALKEIYTAVRQEDGTHPAFMNDNRWPEDPAEAAAGLLSGSDIGSVDLYPIGQFENSLQAVAALSSRVNASCELQGKPSCVWLQLYGAHDAVREPTVEEMRAMAFSTWIHGTRLLSFWTYRPMSQALWRSMKELKDDFARLDRVTSADDARLIQWGTRSGRLHYAAWTQGTRRYLFVSNVAPETVATSFEPAVWNASTFGARTSWFPGTSEVQFGGRLWVFFPAYARQVYEFDAA